jgi:hypothetical protein
MQKAEEMLREMDRGQDESSVVIKSMQEQGNVIAALLHCEGLEQRHAFANMPSVVTWHSTCPATDYPGGSASSQIRAPASAAKAWRPPSGSRARLLTLLDEGRELLARATGSGNPASTSRAFGILRAHAPTNALAAKLYGELIAGVSSSQTPPQDEEAIISLALTIDKSFLFVRFFMLISSKTYSSFMGLSITVWLESKNLLE